MVIRYTVCDDELTNTGNFPYPGFIQGFLHDSILGLPYPGKFQYFPYPGNFPTQVYVFVQKQ